MARELKDKTVVITGGAQGIGFVLAEKFLKRDAKVIIVDVDEKQGAESVQVLNAKHGDVRAEFVKCDVTTNLEAAADKIIKQHNVIDILVNNAGILNKVNEKTNIGVNVTALMVWSVRIFEHMRTDKGGSGGTVINLASAYGYRVNQFLPIYKRLKFTVIGFTRSFGHKSRCHRFGVRCVAMCPTFTELFLDSGVKIYPEEQIVKNCDDSFLKMTSWKKMDAAATITVNIFETAESGTAWLSEDSKAIVEVK